MFLLCAASLLREPILYLSLYFKTHRRLYYELLDRVRTEGDWEGWLEFFLEGVRETADQAAATARRIVDLFSADGRRIAGLGRASASVRRIHEFLQTNPICSIPGAADKLGISAPTVAKSFAHMQKLGTLREITGKRRRRLFAYDRYLAILNAGE